MRYLVAVSGGVDSVVLLDMLVHRGEHELIVAHFDHGIRPDSAEDARFVEGLARKYGVEFVTKREELGEDASEELARRRRYDFLRAEAGKRQAVIVTAHHGDDAVESVAINLLRGTGWRGLAVLDSPDIGRPLLYMTKADIWQYALDRRLEWVQDSTNLSDEYLRNRLRRRIYGAMVTDDRRMVIAARDRQLELKRAIEQEITSLLTPEGGHSRYFFSAIDAGSAIELLRAAVRQAGGALTRPQAERALLAIKTYMPGRQMAAAAGVSLRFSRSSFVVEANEK